MYKATKAFTLAEVIITLIVIGITSSIVIPNLANDIKDGQFYNALKNNYTDVSQAVKMIQTQRGGVVNAGIVSDDATHEKLRDDFCSVLSCTKKDIQKNIWNNGIYYKWYKGDVAGSINGTVNDSAQLSNGTFLSFFSYASCALHDVNACGFIQVDINGRAGPNMFGKDLYEYWIVRKSANGFYTILPTGSQGDSTLPASTCTVGDGQGCAAVRLFNPESMQ